VFLGNIIINNKDMAYVNNYVDLYVNAHSFPFYPSYCRLLKKNKKFNALSVDGRVLCYGGWTKEGKKYMGCVQAPAYGHGRTGTEDINGVGRVGRGYIVKFPHPMHFLPSSDERA
jgi:hypothetical protein